MNGILDPGEPWGFTDAQGGFSVGVPASFDTNGNGVLDDSEGQWVIEGGLDTSTNLPMVTKLIAPATWTVVTPLTTLVSRISNATGMSIAAAEDQLLLAMGLPAGSTSAALIQSLRPSRGIQSGQQC